MRTNVKRSLWVCGAAVTGLLLAGCSATHVGESWQCPLAQGSSCTSIAEADPAVPAGAAHPAVLFGEPLLGAPGRPGGAARPGHRDEGGTCDGECGLLAWFREMFRPGAADPAARTTPEASATVATTEPAAAPGFVVADDASLRVPEVLGRIWIAPFVDAAGIYREAHWVRVVLEPADWKLP